MNPLSPSPTAIYRLSRRNFFNTVLSVLVVASLLVVLTATNHQLAILSWIKLHLTQTG